MRQTEHFKKHEEGNDGCDYFSSLFFKYHVTGEARSKKKSGMNQVFMAMMC